MAQNNPAQYFGMTHTGQEPVGMDTVRAFQAMPGQIADWAKANPMEAALTAGSMFPFVGDAAGIGADAVHYWNNPEDITPTNLGISAMGAAVPFMPGFAGMAKVFQGGPHKYGPEGAAESLKHIGKGEGAKGLKSASNSATMPHGGGGRQSPPSGVSGNGVPQPLPTYPEISPPELLIDKKSGKEYLGKVNSAEAKAVKKQIDAAQRDIDAGNYTPYFDISKRSDVDPSNYDFGTPTLQGNVPQRADTIAKYNALVNDPEATRRLTEAFDEGLKIPGADRWYYMKQLEDEFVKELGPELGRKAFDEKFAKSMASTTGGSDPKSNLRMAMYGNYLRENNIPYPQASYEMPYPIGGRYATGNIKMHDKMAGIPIDPKTNPKRNNFRGNFVGDKWSATIDEQMSGLFDPKLLLPPGNAYGVYEGKVADLAKKAGVGPRDYQDVAWAGAKKAKNPERYGGSKPMIQEVNEMIERTSRVTGLSPEEVVKKGLIGSKIPLYAAAAAAPALGLLSQEQPGILGVE